MIIIRLYYDITRFLIKEPLIQITTNQNLSFKSKQRFENTIIHGIKVSKCKINLPGSYLTVGKRKIPYRKNTFRILFCNVGKLHIRTFTKTCFIISKNKQISTNYT